MNQVAIAFASAFACDSIFAMSIDDSLPTDLAIAHALIIAQRAALSAAEQRASAAESEAQYRALLIEKLKFTIRKLRHDRFGQSSERGALLLDQLELQLADLEADAAQAQVGAQMVAAAAHDKITVRRSNGASRRAVRYPINCRASGLSIRHPRSAHVVAARHCARSART